MSPLCDSLTVCLLLFLFLHDSQAARVQLVQAWLTSVIRVRRAKEVRISERMHPAFSSLTLLPP